MEQPLLLLCSLLNPLAHYHREACDGTVNTADVSMASYLNFHEAQCMTSQVLISTVARLHVTDRCPLNFHSCVEVRKVSSAGNHKRDMAHHFEWRKVTSAPV